MSSLPESFEDYDLIKRLKAINAVLRDPTSSVIEHYAGVSELALFQDVQKVDLLTYGLFDVNPEVRSLCAQVLERSYKLGDTARTVLTLLEGQGSNLSDAMFFQEQKYIVVLIDKMGHLLRKGRNRVIDGSFVDYDRRHVAVLLSGLGWWGRQLQAQYGYTGIHPLKRILEAEQNNWILQLILRCLTSEDVFCRRRTLVAVGELDLKLGSDMPAFDLIMESIDRPQNRHDYLVTWDGIQALTALAQQNPDVVERLYTILHDFYRTRRYSTNDVEHDRDHPFFTRAHCVESLGVLHAYDQLLVLLDNDLDDPVQMMRFNHAYPISGLVKAKIIEGFHKIYDHEREVGNGGLTECQRDILGRISAWVGSQDLLVRQKAIQFFETLDNPDLALQHLLSSTPTVDESIQTTLAKIKDAHTAPGDRDHLFKQLDDLLDTRQQFVTVFGAILLRQTLNTATDVEHHARVVELLRHWCKHQIVDLSNRERDASRLTRVEALWTLYHLTMVSEHASNLGLPPVGLSLQELDELQREQPIVRSVLELFRARHLDALFLEELHGIVTGVDDPFVRICAEIELLIQTGGRNADLTPLATQEIPKRLVGKMSIHRRLALRFMPVLAHMETANATSLIRRLLWDLRREIAPYQALLRSELGGYQCYQLRNDLTRLLLQDLMLRHKAPMRLRFDFLNLLSAGEYQVQGTQKEALEPLHDGLTGAAAQLIAGLETVSRTFEEVELPVLFSEHQDRVVATPGLGPTSMAQLLYAVEERTTDKQIVKAFLNVQNFQNSLVFLERVLTDEEIAQKIRASLPAEAGRVSGQEQRFKGVRQTIVGIVESVDRYGVYVDVGLCSYRPFVPVAQLTGARDKLMSRDQWFQYASELQGTPLSFRIASVAFTLGDTAPQISDLVLTRSDFVVGALAAVTGKTLSACVEGVRTAEDQELGVVFRVEGEDVLVRLMDLSWCRSEDWIRQGWRIYFEQRLGQSFDLTFNGRDWSLCDNQPQLKHFAQLLYQHGSTEFKLVYARQMVLGHVFEIEPGMLCHAPAERLIQSHDDSNRLRFLLPNPDVRPGDILTVRFARQQINGQLEVVLLVLDIEQNMFHEERLRPGMKIAGTLTDLSPDTDRATLVPEEASYAAFSMTIAKLPWDTPEIAEASSVVGRIDTIDPYHYHMWLSYAVAMPDELQVGKSYPCKIAATPRDLDNRLQLSYANVFGFLDERDMTYRHTGVIAQYRRGDRLIARLDAPVTWRNRESRKAIPRNYEQVMAALGLDQQSSTIGDVISFAQGCGRGEREDGTTFDFALSDLQIEGDTPRIFPGNRIQFVRDKGGDLTITVSKAQVHFSILPRVDQPAHWRRYDDVLGTDVELECVYVERKQGCYLLEATPGDVFALPFGLIDEAVSDPDEAKGLWQLTSAGRVKYIPADEDERPMQSDLYTGDMLWVRRREKDGLVELSGYSPGPLHYAAEPWKFDNTIDNPVPIVGQVLSKDIPGGVLVELSYLQTPKGKLSLRHGLVGRYSVEHMSVQDRERFEQNDFRRSGAEVIVVLEKPPRLVRGKLWFAPLHSAALLEELSEFAPEPELPSIFERLIAISNMLKAQPTLMLEGTIKEHDRTTGEFLVALDMLEKYDDYTAVLPGSAVSYSLIRSYQAVESFVEGPRKLFTIRSVDVEAQEITVSLIDNRRLYIDEAAATLDWRDEQILAHATWVGTIVRPSDGDDDPGTRAICIEIVPGTLVDIPLDRLLVDGVLFQEANDTAHVQPGDQITLRVINQGGLSTDGENCVLELVATHGADINILSQPRRVFRGHALRYIGDRVRLELDGYSQVSCYLDLDTVKDRARIAEYDLFRMTRRDGLEIYFRPVSLSDLRRGDRLRVTYEGVDAVRRYRLRVTFGNGRIGYVNRGEVSYQSDFDLEDFQLEPGRSIDAIVARDPTDIVFFKIKDAIIHRLSYLLDSRVQETLPQPIFPAILIPHTPNSRSMVVEIQPTVLVRIPYQRIQIGFETSLTPQTLQDYLLPGDTLEFRLLPRQKYRQDLLLVGLVKSPGHYLRAGVLVRAHYERKNDRMWTFSLPDYQDRAGRLNVPEPILPGVLSPDLRLVVDNLPPDPTQIIPLRLRSPEDHQLVLRVKEIDANSIFVQREDGETDRLQSRNATYRVDYRTTYLREWLKPDEMIIATWNEDRQLSLLANLPEPLTLLLANADDQQNRPELWELTYVRSDGDDRVFEVRPGHLVTVPVSSIWFHGHPLREFRRFVTGDVFKMRIERTSGVEQTKFRVSVASISLSSVRTLQYQQYLEAEVIEILPRVPGIVVRAGTIEQFVHEHNLLPDHSFSSFTVGSKIWLQVQRLDRARCLIILGEVRPPSADQLRGPSAPRTLTVLAQIAGVTPNAVDVDVLGRRVTIWRQYMSWYNADHRVEDLLLPDERSLWVSVFVDNRGTLLANPKQLEVYTVTQQIKSDDIVQAEVLKVNCDRGGRVRNVLVSVDGVRTLIPNDDLVWGLPADRGGVEERQWLAVRVLRAEAPRVDQGYLVVSGRGTSDVLNQMPVGRHFTAVVHYTLDHGLVFNYEGALGYVANDALAWSSVVKAREMFRTGDRITIHKVAPCNEQSPFSLKHVVQIEGLKPGETVEAIVQSSTEAGVYVRVNDLWAFVPHRRLIGAQAATLTRNSILDLRLERVDGHRLLAWFALAHDGEGLTTARSRTDDQVSAVLLDQAYMTALRRFQSLLLDRDLARHLDRIGQVVANDDVKKGPLSLPVTDHTLPEQIVIQLINQCAIPCTHRNIRMLLAWLWAQPEWRSLWSRLARYQVPDKDHDNDTVYVLCQVAREISGLGRQETRASLAAISSYGVGIIALLPDPPHEITLPYALEHMLRAYRFDNTLEVQVALLLIYGRLGLFESCSKLVRLIVERIAGNLGGLLNLPAPLDINVFAYPWHTQEQVRGVQRSLQQVSGDVKEIVRQAIDGGNIAGGEKRLKDMRDTIRIAGDEILEIDLNLALFAALRGDVEGAWSYLPRIARALSRKQRGFALVRDTYFQLALYIHYQRGDWQEILNLLALGIRQNVGTWLFVWLGYMFYASGHYLISQAALQKQGLPTHSTPEHALLHLRWQAEAKSQADLENMIATLQLSLIQNTHEISSPGLVVRLLPESQQTDLRSFIQQVQEYDLPEYALYRYHQEVGFQQQLSDTAIAEGLTKLALGVGQIPLAREIVRTPFNSNRRSPEAARVVANFFRDLRLQTEVEQLQRLNPQIDWQEVLQIAPLSTNNVTRPHSAGTFSLAAVVERWIKSPYRHDRAGQFLVELLSEQAFLARLYWTWPEFRMRVQEALDRCIDYGAIVELIGLIPSQQNLPLAAVEETIFHLLSAGLNHIASDLVKSVRPSFANQSSYDRYLCALEALSATPSWDLAPILPYLRVRPTTRSFEFYTDPRARRSVMHALLVLVQYPDPERQAAMMLLHGELQELDDEGHGAGETYHKLVVEMPHVDAVTRFVAALRLLRLRIRNAAALPTEPIVAIAANWTLYRYQLGKLLVPLANIAITVQSASDCAHLSEILWRLEHIVLTLRSSRQHDHLQIQQLLHALYLLPRGESVPISLYQSLVGTAPLRWDPAAVWELLCLFLDYGIAASVVDDIRQLIDLSLSTTATAYDADVQRTGRPQDIRNRDQMQARRDDLQYIIDWLSPAQLATTSKEIEARARAVLRFLQPQRGRGEDAVRLSAAIVHQATQELIQILGRTHPDFGRATRQLIVRSHLQDNDWRRGLEDSGELDSQHERDQAVLCICFNRLVQGDHEAVARCQGQLSNELRPSLEQLRTNWTIQVDIQEGVGQEQLNQAISIVRFLRRHGEERMAYEYICRLWETFGPTQITDELWQEHIESAIHSYAAPEDVLIILRKASESVRNLQPIAPLALRRYVHHHLTTENTSLGSCLAEIVLQNLSPKGEVVLEELAIVSGVAFHDF